ncbi:MAG: DoxX family protein [Bacteroidales bacterium]|nr:DoxX family protein [Bacteroidales bacterium]
MKNFILYSSPLKENAQSATLLLFRVAFAILLILHGWQKIQSYSVLSSVFPDPVGLGPQLSLTLAIGAEFFAGLFVIAGFLTRLALIPMIFTMGVAFFVTHAADAFQVKELAFVYMVAFVILFITGPGKFSVDNVIFKPSSQK